jgi:hypothetical protein
MPEGARSTFFAVLSRGLPRGAAIQEARRRALAAGCEDLGGVTLSEQDMDGWRFTLAGVSVAWIESAHLTTSGLGGLDLDESA